MINSLFLLIKFIILGVIQGFTEPLPISSSGHLVLLRHFFNVETYGLTFEIIVHFGSLLAVIMVYRRDLITLVKESFLYLQKRENKYATSFRFSSYLLLATLMTGVLGLLLENFISDTLSKVLYIGIAFLITSFFIWLIQHQHGHKTAIDMKWTDAVIIGLCQTLALIPGISRSGTTIVAGMLLGLNRETTLRFSFLLFIPVGFGINIMSIKDVYFAVSAEQMWIPYMIAFLAAMIATYYALKAFIHIMMRGKLVLFSTYCFVIGLFIILSQIWG
ncbi:MAG TPA: undecaprenyl-diphosphate phosphatase [Pseudogracilibacillus sp.]|nr:undecaprenyl-diphosphate phosphatase [Pseudogracilibacillus sp.]